MPVEPMEATRRRPSWLKRIAAFSAAGVLLWLASRLDPTRPQREQAAAEERAARRAEEARVAGLIPEAREAKDEREISFSDLVFDLEPAQVREGGKTGYARWLPDRVKQRDGERVRIEGFMLPTRMEEGGARECLILANQMACCYGQSPRFCEFLVARFTGKPAPAIQDRTLVFQGRLRVADVFSDGAWTALYTLEDATVGR